MSLEFGIVESVDYKFTDLVGEKTESYMGGSTPVGILGKIEQSPVAVLNGLSRNVRYYPEKLWQNVREASYFSQKIQDNSMVATIGHGPEIDEEAYREGIISHYHNNFNIVQPQQYIDEGIGNVTYMVADAYILNTRVGNLLYTYAKSKMKLYWSTRGDGVYLPKKHNGIPVMDPDKYILERIDCVINPGFLHCKLNDLNESSQEAIIETNKKVFAIAESFTKPEHIINENGVNDMAGENTATESTVAQLMEDNKLLQAKAETAIKYSTLGTFEDVKVLVENSGSFKTKFEELNKSFEGLGTAEEIKKKLEELDALKPQVVETKEFIEDYGNFEEIEQVYNTIYDFVEKFGDLKDVGNVIGKVAEFQEKYGDFNKIGELLIKYKGFHEEFGTTHQLKEMVKTYEGFNGKTVESTDKFGKTESIEDLYKVFGTADEVKAILMNIKEAVADPDKIAEGVIVLLDESKAIRISESTGIDFSKVLKRVQRGMNSEEIVEHFNHNSMSNGQKFIATKVSTPTTFESTGSDYFDRKKFGKTETGRIGTMVNKTFGKNS